MKKILKKRGTIDIVRGNKSPNAYRAFKKRVPGGGGGRKGSGMRRAVKTKVFKKKT